MHLPDEFCTRCSVAPSLKSIFDKRACLRACVRAWAYVGLCVSILCTCVCVCVFVSVLCVFGWTISCACKQYYKSKNWIDFCFCQFPMSPVLSPVKPLGEPRLFRYQWCCWNCCNLRAQFSIVYRRVSCPLRYMIIMGFFFVCLNKLLKFHWIIEYIREIYLILYMRRFHSLRFEYILYLTCVCVCFVLVWFDHCYFSFACIMNAQEICGLRFIVSMFFYKKNILLFTYL